MDWNLSGTRYDGQPGVLGWNGISLVGDADSLKAVDLFIVGHNSEIPLSPTGPWIEANKMNETCALALAYNVLGSDGEMTGTPPRIELPALPAGAIA